MTAQTIESHIARIERAVELMAARLQQEETPSLEELAQAAAMSKYHFHRVYRLLSGETCGETLQRLKLARGAAALKRPGARVTDAALLAGYSSSQAFAKALKEAVALPASDLRADPERLATAIAGLSAPRAGGGPAAMRLEIASFDPFEIITIQTHGAYPELNETYWHLFEAAGGPENVRAILGLPMDDFASGPADGHVFTCGLRLNGEPGQDIARQTLAGGLFLLLRHEGSYDTLLESVDRMYAAALGLPGVELADGPPVFHYLDDPEETAEDALRTDIYLPITYPGIDPD